MFPYFLQLLLWGKINFKQTKSVYVTHVKIEIKLLKLRPALTQIFAVHLLLLIMIHGC